MSKKLVKTEIDVIDNKIGIMRIGDVDYISLTDLARYADAEEPRLPIRDWMRNKEVIFYRMKGADHGGPMFFCEEMLDEVIKFIKKSIAHD